MIVAVFWLAASAAWANGVIGLKNAAASENWLFISEYSVCHKGVGGFDKPGVHHCVGGVNGSYGGANASVVSNQKLNYALGDLRFLGNTSMDT